MTPEERRHFVAQLVADYLAAKEQNSQCVATWMNLARRYMAIGANMNWAECVRRAQACPLVVTVAVETVPA